MTTLERDRLLSVEEIRKASKPREQKICGVYFLFKKDVLVYVGQSVNVLSRVVDHVRTKEFDRYSVIECPPEELNDLESAYILAFKPKENNLSISCNRPEGLRITAKTPAEWRDYYNQKRMAA